MEENYIGKITINNTDLQSINSKSLRSKIHYISNNKFIITGSIYENLCLGKEFKTNDILNACHNACILEFIESLPKKFDTIILESGKNLSLGQAQRLLIARTLLHNPEVVIFDESMSNIDKTNKKIIMNNLSSYNFIKIFITHDPINEYYDKVFEIKDKNLKLINQSIGEDII